MKFFIVPVSRWTDGRAFGCGNWDVNCVLGVGRKLGCLIDLCRQDLCFESWHPPRYCRDHYYKHARDNDDHQSPLTFLEQAGTVTLNHVRFLSFGKNCNQVTVRYRDT